MQQHNQFRTAIFCLFLLTLGVTGCSESKVASEIRELNRANIQKISNAFTLYHVSYGYKGPKNKEELVEFVTKTNSERSIKSLKRMGISRTEFEGYFISEIDGEEFILRYGARIPANGDSVPLVFETTGDEDGVRRVGFNGGKIVEADKATYDRLMKGKLKREDLGEREGVESTLE